MYKFIQKYKEDGETIIVSIKGSKQEQTVPELKNMFIQFLCGCGFSEETITEHIGEWEIV